MNVRYVIVDEEFFMLVEPDFTSFSGQYKVKIQIKQPIKMVEAMVDKTEPRNLIVGLFTLQKGQ